MATSVSSATPSPSYRRLMDFLIATIVALCMCVIVVVSTESVDAADKAKRWSYQNYVEKKWNYDNHLADKKWDYANHLEKKWNYDNHLADKKWNYNSHLIDKKWNYDGHLADKKWDYANHLEKKWNYDNHLADKKWDYANHLDKKWNYDGHLAEKKWNYDGHLADKKWDYANHLDKKWNYDGHLAEKKWNYDGHLADKKWDYAHHLEKKWNYDNHLADKKWDYNSHLVDKKWNYGQHFVDKKWDYTNHLLEKKWDYQDYIMRRADLPANLLFDKRFNDVNRLNKKSYPDDDTYEDYEAELIAEEANPINSVGANATNLLEPTTAALGLKRGATNRAGAKKSLLSTPSTAANAVANSVSGGEEKCPESTPFKCPSGPCISIQYLCNGVNDCPSGYDEDIRVCTAARRPPVEETVNFMRNMLKNEQGRAFLQLLFGKRLTEGKELEKLGGVKRVATLLAESPTVEDFAANCGMNQAELERMREVLVATVMGELEKIQALTGSAVQLKSLEADLKYFLEKLVASHFLE